MCVLYIWYDRNSQSARYNVLERSIRESATSLSSKTTEETSLTGIHVSIDIRLTCISHWRIDCARREHRHGGSSESS